MTLFFTVTFDQFSVSLLNKSFISLKKSYWPQTKKVFSQWIMFFTVFFKSFFFLFLSLSLQTSMNPSLKTPDKGWTEKLTIKVCFLPCNVVVDWLKGTYYAKFTFTCMVFEHKCVLAVCVHNHHIMVKPIHYLFFFLNPHESQAVSQIKPFAVSMQCDVTLHRPRPWLASESALSA